MTRYEMRHMKPRKINVYKMVLTFAVLLVCIGVMLGFSRYAQSTIKIEAPVVDNGKKVIVTLPNGHKVYTFENLIVVEDGKLFYKGERNTIDLTGGNVEYKDW
ncbi:hypothetical protein [Neobacillus sp. YIM B06451]|uniref:hypothetical protein n=1 Tax=Neobacillus sp. YIM B06451 TaxID=3070994 RepID=UPI00292E423C|nr:hypothetical protein [Neobacillus sp. YIM B06451]